MVTVDRGRHANHAVTDIHGDILSDDDSILNTFGEDSPIDPRFTNNPKFADIFQHQTNQVLAERGQYKESNRRASSKSKRDTSDSLPPLKATMSLSTRSRGPPPEVDENNSLVARVPRKNKLPTKANNAETSSPITEGSLRNINNLQKFSKQDQAKTMQTKMEIYVAQFAEEDKNKTKPQLMDTLVGVRKDFFVNYRLLQQSNKTKSNLEESIEQLQHDLNKVETDNTKLKDEMNGMERTHEELVEALHKKIAKLKNKRTANLIEKKDGVSNQVQEQSRGWLFSRIKFIQSPGQELDAAKLLFKEGKFDDDVANTKQKRADLAETYKTLAKRHIFYMRNYTSSECKKLVFKRLNTNGCEALTLQQLLNCLQRKIETEEDMEAFKIYWDEYLSRHIGATEWGERIRLYTTISLAKRKDFPQMKLITPEDEAFLVLSIHNGLDRWIKEFNNKKAKALADGDEGGIEADQPKKKGGNFDGLFTRTGTGQNHWGGWTQEGLELFNHYKALNIEARKDPNCDKVEKDCLYKLRKDRGIEDDNADDHAKTVEARKRLKKRGLADATLPPKKKIIQTFVVPSDTSDDEEEDDENGDD